MKQPKLGEKLIELRQKNNMTQEELVEACNVSVRTIQRIESGEVTPRVSTIKIIVSALGEELDILKSKQNYDPNLSNTESWLQIAWISGIVAFILGFIDSGIELARFESGILDMPIGFYLSIKSGSLISYILFIIGIIKLGDFFENRLLSISGYLLIGLSMLLTSSDVLSVFYEGTIMSWMAIGTGLMMGFGSIGVVFGVGLIRLQDAMGKSAKVAGILEIVAGICLITVLFVVVGLVVYIPAMILEIILLFKASEFIRSERVKK